jgi:hypothetical protein
MTPIVHYVLKYPNSDKTLISNDMDIIHEEAMKFLKNYRGLKILTVEKRVDEYHISNFYISNGE